MHDIITIEECITRLDAIRHEIVPDSRDHFALSSGIAALYEIENGVPAVNRWIPVEDDLPEIGYSVLVTRQTESNTRYIRIASRQHDCWMDNTDKYGKPNPHQVIAWMPMPDAYKPPEKECDDDAEEE